MNENNILLETKLVGQIRGKFYVPSYQRGYRWDEQQVKALLSDIYHNGDQTYCLQPIVVRQDELGRFELIDGQQRLTTLYIIHKYLSKKWPEVFNERDDYSISYETRSGNEDFFNHIDDEEKARDNIDYFFMYKAYKAIDQWFRSWCDSDFLSMAKEIAKQLNQNVRVIWYELRNGTREDATKLFTRLNIGRIPLTNAELIKALFLCRSDKVTRDRRMEIALQWDMIEHELHDEDFWYFLTKNKAETYDTRIELLFDFITSTRENRKDPLSIFLHFNCHPMDWNGILRYFYRLKEWYKSDTYYHKIGYLVASGTKTIDKLMEETANKRRSEVAEYLEDSIKQSIDTNKPYGELTYDNDYNTISNLLLLFNILSLKTTRFPFKEFNTEHWSLEHIHAQHSKGLNTQEKWVKWLKEHKPSIDNVGEKELSVQMQVAIDNGNLTRAGFEELSSKVLDKLGKLSEKSNVNYIHSIANMALLQGGANAALNNSAFDVKRRKIREMDAAGYYIPHCTKMVFAKQYSSERRDNVNFYYWGESDRKDYIEKLNEVLEPYLKEKIHYASE